MADGTSIAADGYFSAKSATRRPGSMRKFLRKRSTIGFLMALPLILLVAGMNRKKK